MANSSFSVDSLTAGNTLDSPLAAASAAPPRIPDYELLRLIGQGSYGHVWLARSATGALRALKIVYRASFDHDRPYDREFEGIKKFEPLSQSRETQVAIFHVARHDAFFYYVMELADDASVAADISRRTSKPAILNHKSEIAPHSSMPHDTCSMLNATWSSSLDTYVPHTLKHSLKQGPLPLPEVLSIAQSLATALDHLHSHGLVHRDIKPSNIIFVNGRPKLADIGLVTSTDATRSFVGTDGYIPPEGPGTPQADLYSLGKVLYECVTGKDRTEFPELPDEWRTRAELDRFLEFNEILTKACDSNPLQRYANAADMLAEITLLAADRGSVRQRRNATRRNRHLKRLALILSLVAAVVVPSFVVLHISKKGARSESSRNPEARRLFELARWHFNQNPGSGSAEAFTALERALKLDPTFIAGHILQFEMYVWRFRSPPREVAANSERIARTLLSLDPLSGPAHAARAWSKHCQFQWEESIAELKTAIQLSPDYPMAHVLYALVLTKLGRFEEARPEFSTALQLDSTSRMISVVASFPDYYSNSHSNAILQFRKALELEPNSFYAWSFIGSAYERAGDYPAAIESFRATRLRNGEDPAAVQSTFKRRSEAYLRSGEAGYWEDIFKSDFASNPKPDLQTLANVYVHLGEKQKALDCLEQAFDSTTYTAVWLKIDSDWNPLHTEPRFQALLRRANFPE